MQALSSTKNDFISVKPKLKNVGKNINIKSFVMMTERQQHIDMNLGFRKTNLICKILVSQHTHCMFQSKVYSNRLFLCLSFEVTTYNNQDYHRICISYKILFSSIYEVTLNSMKRKFMFKYLRYCILYVPHGRNDYFWPYKCHPKQETMTHTWTKHEYSCILINGLAEC
jgi:hypothetical protein